PAVDPPGTVAAHARVFRSTEYSFPQPGSRHGAEEDSRAARLFGVSVVENSTESAAIDFHGSRAGSSADGAAGVVELDGVIHVPRFAVVRRDDEIDFLSADAGADDLRGE